MDEDEDEDADEDEEMRLRMRKNAAYVTQHARRSEEVGG